MFLISDIVEKIDLTEVETNASILEEEDKCALYKCDTDEELGLDTSKELKDFIHNVIVTDASGNMRDLGIFLQYYCYNRVFISY